MTKAERERIREVLAVLVRDAAWDEHAVESLLRFIAKGDTTCPR